MHVPQLLNLFLLAPQIEIVETSLPEATVEFAPNSQPPRDAQLHVPPAIRHISDPQIPLTRLKKREQLSIFGLPNDYLITER
jgi:hypothetical protein